MKLGHELKWNWSGYCDSIQTQL